MFLLHWGTFTLVSVVLVFVSELEDRTEHTADRRTGKARNAPYYGGHTIIGGQLQCYFHVFNLADLVRFVVHHGCAAL